MSDQPTDQTDTDTVDEAPPEQLHLLGREVKLHCPDSVAERYDVIYARQEGAVQLPRLVGAALGLAWPHLRRKLARSGVKYTGDIAEFGGKALDMLLAGGDSWGVISGWGSYAMNLIATDLPGLELPTTKDDAEIAVGNSSDGEGSKG